MQYRKLLIFFCFSFFGFKAFPAVFVVTSNADSGPGTLREALTLAAANDSTQTDYINFNLPDLSPVGRTIILITQLPDVSSNLIIDASTQPGAKFGISDAHVQLMYQTPALRSLSGLRIVNHHDVAVYGLYINLPINSSTTYLGLHHGIELRNDKNIHIGDTGKGNVVNGFYYPLSVNSPDTISRQSSEYYFENLILKDNFFGIDSDGETLSVNQVNAVSLYFIVGQVVIGGTATEGNLFAQGLFIYQVNVFNSTNPQDYYVSAPATIQIKSNKIGVDYGETKAIATSAGITLETVNPGGKNTCYIEDNIITNQNNFSAIFIANNGGPVSIKRNYIGINKTLQNKLPTSYFGIWIRWSDLINIGSANPADANYITGCKPVYVNDFATASVNRNSFFCTVGAYPMIENGNSRPLTTISILNVSINGVSGIATPNSVIELFYSDYCGTCSPQTYFASTTADNTGKWQYNGPITGTVIASATYNNSTSEFSRTTINVDSIKIINTCINTGGVGSIKGIIPKSAANVKWLDINGNIVGTSADLLNVKPGKYKLIAQNGNCSDSTNYFEIRSKFQLDTGAIKRTEPSCGNSKGSISGINLINNDFDAPATKWRDINGKVLATSLDLNNAPAGSYYLLVKSADSTCSQTFGPFSLKNVSGPNIDQSNISIQSTNCGQSTGSITNLNVTGTGTLKYTWLNNQQQTVSTTKNLINQPGGIYKLQVTDDTQCGPIYSANIEIPETNGIVLDESAVQTKVASCSSNNGSITGLKITGATQYQWADATNKIVGTAADLQNMAAGDYILTASNSFGCSKTSKTYHIGLQPPTQYPAYDAAILNSCFGANTGSVTVTTDALVASVRWVNSQGNTIGNAPVIANIPGGAYQLYLTDKNGCESLYKSYTVTTIPQLQIVSGSEQIFNDQCGLRTGNVTGIQVAGGLQPYSYAWIDANNRAISSSVNLSGVSVGNYTLQVTDASKCNVASAVYAVQNQNDIISPPEVRNVQLCSPGDALLEVSNPSAVYTYRLYDSETSATPLDQQSKGTFKTAVTTDKDFYISQVSGDCESARTIVHISVGLTTLDIANTFTPNGDGINDYWKITGIGSYPDAIVQVFTRYGGKLFESKGYIKPFDGTSNGRQLPSGVYYYIINLSTKCSLLTGSLTIIR